MKKNAKFSNNNYIIQDIKYVQHKSVNMSWDYSKFSCHPVADERFKMIVRNIIDSNCLYRVDPNLGKGV